MLAHGPLDSPPAKHQRGNLNLVSPDGPSAVRPGSPGDGTNDLMEDAFRADDADFAGARGPRTPRASPAAAAPVAVPPSPPGGGGGGCIGGPLRSFRRTRKDGKHLLRVDKILCRVPSHESNISDLSASLSPNLPRGPAVGAAGPVGANCGGIGLHSVADPTHLGSPNFDPNYLQDNAKSTEGGRGNIVYSMLTDCGMFENVSDLLTVVQNGSMSVTSTQGGVAHGNLCNNPSGDLCNGPTARRRKKGGFGDCYDRPNIWGMSPDDDVTDEDTATEQETTSSKLSTIKSEGNSVEYDNVELVLDESALMPEYMRESPSSMLSSQQKSQFSGSSRLTGKSGGRKSPGAGILKNKLGKLNRRSPTPTISSIHSTPSVGFANALGGLGNVKTVVESNKDHRISHVYDTTEFENEKLQPGFSRSMSEKADGGVPRGGTPVSNRAVPTPSPVSLSGLGGASDGFNLVTSVKKGVSAGVEHGQKKANEEMFCQPCNDGDRENKQVGQMQIFNVGDGAMDDFGTTQSSAAGVTFAGGFWEETPRTSNLRASPTTPEAIPSKVQLAMDASAGMFNTGEEVEVDNAPYFKEEEEPAREKKSSRGGKLLKGLSFKPRSKSAARKARSKSSKKRSKSLMNLGRSSNSNSASKDSKDSKEDMPVLSVAQLEDAKKWKATYDKGTNKTYYYHRETKEVTWEKPLGFDEAVALKREAKAKARGEKNDENVGEVVAPSTLLNNNSNKGRRGFGLKKGRKSPVNDGAEAATGEVGGRSSPGADVNATKEKGDDEAKYWKATLDASTGKTYYYNKKTKGVSWEKPPGFDDGSVDDKEGVATDGVNNGESLADKRKKMWFKKDKKDEKTEAETAEKLTPAEEEQACPEIAAINSREEGANGAIADAVEEDKFAKYWRATLDTSTGKTYYFNKKTKVVTWKKPPGFKEKEPKQKRAEEKPAEHTPALEALAEVVASAEKVDEEEEETAAAALEPEGATWETTEEEETVVEEAEDQMEELSEIEGFTDEEAVDAPMERVRPASKQDAPFDEPGDAPFDEPFDEPKSAPSPQRMHFQPRSKATPTPPQAEGEEQYPNQERTLSSGHASRAQGAPLLYGRVKSLKSIDFENASRQRTFASQMTEETKKAANLATGSGGVSNCDRLASKLDDSQTLGSTSLNQSSIACSEIFAPFGDALDADAQDDGNFVEDEEQAGRTARGKHPSPGHRPPSETAVRRDELRSQLPQLPATPPRAEHRRKSSRSASRDGARGGGGNHHHRRGTSPAEEETSHEEASEEEEETASYEEDEVSALSGIGNDSIEKRRSGGGRRGWRGSSGRRRGGRGGGEGRHGSSRDRRSDKSRSRSSGKEKHKNQRGVGDDKPREWTQQELDSFIAKNDWGSVSKYINEMRVSKDIAKAASSDRVIRKQPSVREIQERIEYNRRLHSESSRPRTRFGARSQMQHDDTSASTDGEEEGTDDREGEEDRSEDVWRSLESETSYEEESSEDGSSQYYRQSTSGRGGGRRRREQRRWRSLSRGRRRRSSPREAVM